MEFIALSTKPRTRTGKGGARALRREGRIPAVLYGPDTETRMLSVDAAGLQNHLKKHPASLSVFKLALDDDSGGTTRSGRHHYSGSDDGDTSSTGTTSTTGSDASTSRRGNGDSHRSRRRSHD